MTGEARVIEGLPDETQRLLQAYAKDVKRAYGDRLEGLLVYGSAVRGEFLPGRSNLNLLLFLTNYDASALAAYAPIHKRWSKEHVVVPLFLSERDLQMASSLFPLEFFEIQDYHRTLGGRDPFIGIHLNSQRLGDEVMQHLAGNAFRLRQRLAEAGGANDAVTILLPLAVTSSIPALRGVQRMMNWPVLSQSDAVIKDIADRLALDLGGFQDALLLKRGQITPGPAEIPRLFDRYLRAAETLAESVIAVVKR